MTLPAYILAGGHSRRFGSDKARALVDGVPLLDHAARDLREVASTITVVGATRDAYADLGHRTIADATPHRGPLGGLEAALVDARTRDDAARFALVTCCDWLGFRAAWIRTLVAAAFAEDERATPGVAFHDGRWQPLPAVYALELLPEVTRRLAAGPTSLHALLEDTGAHRLPAPADFASAQRMNTPPA